MKKNWPQLHKQVELKLNRKSNTNALATGETKDLSKVCKVAESKVPRREGTILEHFNMAKISVTQQATIDLLLFKFFVCCAIPFDVIDNIFFCEFVNGLAANYVVPECTAFFTRHIGQETAAFNVQLRVFLEEQEFLTLSYDGWSTQAKNEIYT